AVAARSSTRYTGSARRPCSTSHRAARENTSSGPVTSRICVSGNAISATVRARCMPVPSYVPWLAARTAIPRILPLPPPPGSAGARQALAEEPVPVRDGPELLHVRLEADESTDEEHAVPGRLEQAVLEGDLPDLHRAVDGAVGARIVAPVLEHGLEDDAHDADHRRRIVVAVEEAEPDERVGHRGLVAVDDRAGERDVRRADRLREHANAAEVEHAEPRMVRHEVVPWMRVRVQD